MYESKSSQRMDEKSHPEFHCSFSSSPPSPRLIIILIILILIITIVILIITTTTTIPYLLAMHLPRCISSTLCTQLAAGTTVPSSRTTWDAGTKGGEENAEI